jgi:hypothetical protein
VYSQKELNKSYNFGFEYIFRYISACPPSRSLRINQRWAALIERLLSTY